MAYLQNLNRLSGADNLGGILFLKIARAADIASIPDPVAGVVYGDIEFKPGKGFVTWEVTPDTSSADSRSRRAREGASKTNRIPFFIPKDRASIRAMLEQAEQDELIVVYTDANGKQKIFGQLDTPVQFEFDHSSGKRGDDLNHYDCNFFYEGPDNMYEYNGAVPTPPAGSAPAIVTVNGTVVASLQPGDTLNFDTDFDFDFQIVGT